MMRRACGREAFFPPMKAATDSKAAMLFFLPSSSRDFFGVRIVNGRSVCSLDPLLLVMDHCPWAASSFRPSGNSFLAFADLTSSFIRVKRKQRDAGWTEGEGWKEGRRAGPGGMESVHPIIPYLKGEQRYNCVRKLSNVLHM